MKVMEEQKDYKERIFSFIFDAQDDICWILHQDKITNYLECKNLQDIYNSLYDSKTLDVNIEKREIYGQLDNYKFTFDIITRDIKSIQNLETGEFVKISLNKQKNFQIFKYEMRLESRQFVKKLDYLLYRPDSSYKDGTNRCRRSK